MIKLLQVINNVKFVTYLREKPTLKHTEKLVTYFRKENNYYVFMKS